MKKQNKADSASTSIRERLGLSQSDWASYMGVSKGHLAMHEINKRPLPAAASLKISDHLTQHHKNPVNLKKAITEKPDKYFAEDFLSNLEITLHQQTKKLKAAQAKLQDMQKRYSQAVHLHHYARLQQQSTNLTEFETLWLAAHLSQSAIDKDNYGPLPQQQLQWLIDSLQVYVTGANALTDKMKKEK